ncbi:TPA: hypothetical protein ENG04_03050, partial [Candidatus Poribacteria bacterium]|nr:hypothetical protein [Candidatus Poribacteria bacterium]HEX29040.1 hypothetical protein [Candidatus Poribacteria bacterium]
MRIKRRYMLLLSFILFLALVSPILYPKWSERRRLKKIEEIRKEAVKQEGMELKDALKLFETENPSLIILFTGNTKGYLETCGCFEGQSGGVARRATVIKRLRKKTPILLVDAGGILQGDEPLDRLRTKVYLECMRKMGYDAICPEGDEIDLLSKSSITLISANVHTTGIVPSLIKRVGGVQIGILGLSKPEGTYSEEMLITSLQGELSRLRKKADIVLLLSNLPVLEIRKVAEEVKGIDYIISSERGDQEKIDETYLLFSSPKGERLGFLAMKLPSMKTFSGSILLGDDVPDDQEIRAILNRFYKTVAEEQGFQKSGELLTVRGNGYIGSE